MRVGVGLGLLRDVEFESGELSKEPNQDPTKTPDTADLPRRQGCNSSAKSLWIWSEKLDSDVTNHSWAGANREFLDKLEQINTCAMALVAKF